MLLANPDSLNTTQPVEFLQIFATLRPRPSPFAISSTTQQPEDFFAVPIGKLGKKSNYRNIYEAYRVTERMESDILIYFRNSGPC